MENTKTTRTRSSSDEEPPKRSIIKQSKTHHKITLPLFGIHRKPDGKLWWRRFIQYIKLTQDIDLNTLTTVKEILEEKRDDLENWIKDIFFKELGEAVVTEMTRTIRDNGTNKLDRYHIYCIFPHFIPKRNNFYSNTYFLGITREPNETADDVWIRT